MSAILQSFMHHRVSPPPLVQPIASLQHGSNRRNTSPLTEPLKQSHSPQSSTRSTTLPLVPGFTLAADSDSGLLGDRRTTATQVDLVGLTSPGAVVTLQSPQAGISRRTVANGSGQFLFTNLPLSAGQNLLTATARTQSGTRRFTSRFNRVTADQTDVILDWNRTLLRTLQLEQAGGLTGSRSLAILHLAMFNTVEAFNTSAPLPASTLLAASVEAAAAGAAHEVLSQLYPDQKLRLDDALTQALLKIQQPEAIEAEGVALGRRIAQQVLVQRQADGSQATVSDQVTIQPGTWRPTPPRFQAAIGVNWSQVTPFVLAQGSQFRPVAPPKLTSRTYAQELEQVKRLGQIDSSFRTEEQTQVARFWLGSAGSSTSPGQWNEIAAKAAVQSGQTLQQNARLFAQLNLALADAGIASWDAKYAYRSWRPITAIRLAGSDGNSATQADRTWQPLIETPAHPDYVSAHSTFAGAAAAVLTRQFEPSSPVIVTAWDLPGVQRRFRSFQQAASEAGISRIYGGIHTRSANRAGLTLGGQVGNQVLRTTL
jgi:PAP2 superfamily